jgi:hypothetical protein
MFTSDVNHLFMSVEDKCMRIERFENVEFQDVYDHTGRTRAGILNFIKYSLAYEQGQPKKDNPER